MARATGDLVTDLNRHDPPDVLVWLDGLAREDWQSLEPWLTGLQEKSDGLGEKSEVEEEPDPFDSGFLPPEAPVEMTWTWQRLASDTRELARSEFSRRQQATDAVDISLEWPGEREDDVPPYHQLLGVPFP